MNNAANTNDLRMDIINLLIRINDVNKLKLIYKQAEALEEMPESEEASEPKLEDAVAEISEGVTLEQIFQEQNYQPVDYQAFRRLADQIEWEHSLEELLKCLD